MFVAAWQIFAVVARSLLIPAPLETAQAFVGHLSDGAVWSALATSNESFAIGLGVSIAVGIPVGLLMGRFPRTASLIDPYLSIAIITPMAIIIPILVMSIGIGIESRIVTVMMFAVVSIIVNAQTGVRQVPPELIEMARSNGANELTIWRHVLLPDSVPAIMTGIRIGIGRGITGMVLAELLLASVGVGNLLSRYRALMEPARVFALIGLIVLESLVLISIARKIEERSASWATDNR